MIQLYYTGSVALNGEQPDPMKSIGGYKSISPLSNGSLNQLFNSVSYFAQRDGTYTCRGLVLVNEGVAITNLKVYFVYPDTVNCAKLLVGVEALSSNFSIQRLSRTDALPNVVEFSEPTIDNKTLLISTLPANSAIGIWIKREVFSPNPTDAISSESLDAYLTARKKIESINMVFDF